MRKLLIIALAFVMLLALAGCACEHEWLDADCINPKTCAKCEEVEGAPLGHTWSAATCVDPKICENCAATEGEPKGHEWVEANCTEPNICSVCGETDGEPLGHAWVDATEYAPKTCSACGVTEGDPLPMVRHDLGMTYESMATTMNTAMNVLGYELEYHGIDEEGLPTYFVNSLDGKELDIAVYFELMEDGVTVYSVTVITGDVADTQTAIATGIVGGVAIGISDPTITQDVITSIAEVEPIEVEGMNVYAIEFNGLMIMMMEGTGMLGFYVSPVE